MYITERMETRVAGEYDVAVCGGGFAGISAAPAADRLGKKGHCLNGSSCRAVLAPRG